MSICWDMFTVCPWMVDIRRATSSEIRSDLMRAKRRHLPANTSGLGDMLARGGEVPSEGTSLLFLAAQTCGAGYRSEKAPTESIDRVRPNRAPI